MPEQLETLGSPDINPLMQPDEIFRAIKAALGEVEQPVGGTAVCFAREATSDPTEVTASPQKLAPLTVS